MDGCGQRLIAMTLAAVIWRRLPRWTMGSRSRSSPPGRAQPRNSGRLARRLAPRSVRPSWYLPQEPAGKIVRGDLDAGTRPNPSEAAGSAPPALILHRIGREQEKRPVETTSDPDILRRVRDRPPRACCTAQWAVQGRYAGDLGDYLKFGLLRWLARTLARAPFGQETAGAGRDLEPCQLFAGIIVYMALGPFSGIGWLPAASYDSCRSGIP